MNYDNENSPIVFLGNHLQKFIGVIDKVWHSTDDKDIHIDIYQFAPTIQRPYWTLVTSGMSFQPQYIPDDRNLSGRTELIIYVSEVQGWMLNVMKGLAEMPFDDKTYLHWNHTVPNGKPMTSEPSQLTSFFFVPAFYEDREFNNLKILEEKIDFLWIIPITENERQYALDNGSEALDELLWNAELGQVLDEKRLSFI
jgi:hypothetical protein